MRAVTSRTRHSWVGVLAFIVLLVVGGSGLVLWRLDTVELISVQAGGMQPLIHKGDAVVVDRQAHIESGDVITYYDPFSSSNIKTERVVNIDATNKLITTKGDTVAKSNAPFSYELVIGKVNYHILKMGYALNFLRSPIGLIIAIYVPALIIVMSELRRLSGVYAVPKYRLYSRTNH